MIHELKIWPQYYCRVADGSKTFEVRKNDRGFQPGDLVILREYDPEKDETYDNGIQNVNMTGGYTNASPLEFRVGYVLPIDNERVVFSLIAKEMP